MKLANAAAPHKLPKIPGMTHGALAFFGATPIVGPMQQDQWVPLVDYRRNGVAECTIHGSIAWVSGQKLIYSYGGEVLCYGRSMMKPHMIKVFVKELDPVLNWEQKAIAVSSHNGDSEHIRVVQSILSESELGLVQTPLTLPLMQFGAQRRRPRRLYHSCSGEHAAILKGCKLKRLEPRGLRVATP